MLIIALFCGAACSAPQNDVLRREVKFEKRSVQMNSQASKVKLADKIDPIKHFLIGFECAGHGTNSVGDRPITGSYRQV